MKVSPLTKDQKNKVYVTILYVTLSAAISATIAAIAQNADLFGPLTPVVNVVLVAAKQFFSEK